MAFVSYKREKESIKRAGDQIDSTLTNLILGLHRDKDAAFVLSAMHDAIDDLVEKALDEIEAIERRKALEE